MSDEQLTPEEIRQLQAGTEAEVILLCQQEHERLLLAFPDYADAMSFQDPEVCRRADLVQLIREAPNEGVRQFLYATILIRQTLHIACGRAFS